MAQAAESPAPDRRGAASSRGLRIDRVPSKPVRREPDGNLTIDLWLRRDGRFDADLALRLSPAEAELLHAQLCYALDDIPVMTTHTDRTPVCRQSGGRGTEVRRRP